MRYLKTKTAAYMLAEGFTKITIVPVLKVVDKVSDKYHDTKANLEVSWIKKNLENMTAQEKFDAVIKHREELNWIQDPIVQSTITVLHVMRTGRDKKDFEIAYSFLRSSGVEKFTPAIDAYYILNINNVTV